MSRREALILAVCAVVGAAIGWTIADRWATARSADLAYVSA